MKSEVCTYRKLSPLADSLFYQLEAAGFNPKVIPKDGRFDAIALDNPAYLRQQLRESVLSNEAGHAG
jgi:hypothetical protein